MSKARLLAILVCAALLVASFASPALGGPSIRSIAKTAKKALRLAKKADRKSSQALNTYALLKTVEREQTIVAPPDDFARFDVRCPNGYVPTGHGVLIGPLQLVGAIPVPGGYIGSMGNLGGSQPYDGTLQVICTYGDWSASAAKQLSRASAMRALQEAERDYYAATRAGNAP